MKLSCDYRWNTAHIAGRLRVSESFDIIERHLDTAGGELTLFYIDGFVKDGEMQRMMQYLLSAKSCPTKPQKEEDIAIAKWCSKAELEENLHSTYPTIRNVFAAKNE